MSLHTLVGMRLFSRKPLRSTVNGPPFSVREVRCNSGALRPSSSFRHFVSMFLVKSKDHSLRFAPTFLVPTLRRPGSCFEEQEQFFVRS